MALKKTRFGASIQSALGSFFSHLPLTPNQLTVSAVAFAAVGFFLSLQQQALPSLAFFTLAGAVDALDGAVARARKQVTARGAYIDGITDRLVEFLLVLSFFQYAIPPFIFPAVLSLICILFFGSTMSSFATAYAEHRHVADAKKIACQPGILPRAERLLMLFAAMLLIVVHPAFASITLFAEALLCAWTFFQRFWYYSKE